MTSFAYKPESIIIVVIPNYYCFEYVFNYQNNNEVLRVK